MRPQEYHPKVKSVQCEMLPLLPGLGARLEEMVEYPEVKMVHAVKGEFGNWTIDESLVASYWNPGSEIQTCFSKVEDFSNGKTQADYYQVEYYHIPELIRNHIDNLENKGETWVVTEVNNLQMKEWLEANSVITHSEVVIRDFVKQHNITYTELNAYPEPSIDVQRNDRDENPADD